MTTQTFRKTDGEMEAATELVEQLFRTHQRPLLAYVYVLLQNREDAYDITQDTFVDLLTQRQKLLTVRSPQAWTYRIALRRASSWLKRIRRFQWLPWRPMDDRPQLVWEGHETALSRSLAIQRVLRRLPRPDLNVLILFHHVGLSAREIGQVLDLSESGVRSRIRRARRTLEALYREEIQHD